jgi:hypothetical protein
MRTRELADDREGKTQLAKLTVPQRSGLWIVLNERAYRAPEHPLAPEDNRFSPDTSVYSAGHTRLAELDPHLRREPRSVQRPTRDNAVTAEYADSIAFREARLASVLRCL